MTDTKRYDRFGWDYERWNPRDPRAERWLADRLVAAGGPALELACGTGRLLCALAEAGLEVTGLDLSKEMLRLAERRVARRAAEVRGRIRLVRADMAAFDLGRTFRSAVLADNSFRELTTRAALLRCLRRVRRHLEPGGRFLLVESRPRPELLEAGRRSWPWSEPLVDPESGESVRRRVELETAGGGRRLRGHMIYEVTRPDGSVEVVELPYTAPLLEVGEYRGMLRSAGLAARLEEFPDERFLAFAAEAV